MKKQTLIKNTFLLIFGGMVTKILGFIIKILYTRILKADGVSLISLVFPTYSLLLTLSSFALPLAVMKLVAEKKERKSKILFSSFWITFAINSILVLLCFTLSKPFSIYLLHDNRCTPLIKILVLILPFVSITSLIKAYFYGIENVKPIIISNILEEIVKLSLVALFLESMVKKGIIYGASFYLVINLLCEIASFFILFVFLPRKISLNKLNYKYDFKLGNKLFKTCIPTLSGKLIGNIGFFLEPILLTCLLIFKGFEKRYIIINYGYYEAYVIALLTIPSFFLMALSSNLIPLITKYRTHDNYRGIKKTINLTISITLLGGTAFSLILFFKGKLLMNILYKTSKGLKYLKCMSLFFPIFYLETPLLSILQALNQENKVLKITSYGILIKYIFLGLFIFLNLDFMSLIYAEIINVLFVVYLCFYYLKRYFYNFS